MAGPNTQKDNASKDGAAKARPGQAPPPPQSKPARLGFLRLRFIGPIGRFIGVIGGWIAAPFKAAWRKTLAGFAAAAGLARGLMRREAIPVVAAVVAAAAAVLAWTQSVDTEARQVSAELLSRFNSDEMGRATLTLERYYYLLSGDRIAPADLARTTEDYFRSFVYQKAAPPSGRLGDRIRFGSDRDKQEDFLRQVDQSRRRVKNFYEDVVVFSEGHRITSALREKVLKGRFYRNAGDFLECFWLPVELGQNAALYQGRKTDNDKRACSLVDWYRDRYPVAGRAATPCVAYAPRQPDYCIDPKAEARLAQSPQRVSLSTMTSPRQGRAADGARAAARLP
jgi:hypothetical protein